MNLSHLKLVKAAGPNAAYVYSHWLPDEGEEQWTAHHIVKTTAKFVFIEGTDRAGHAIRLDRAALEADGRVYSRPQRMFFYSAEAKAALDDERAEYRAERERRDREAEKRDAEIERNIMSGKSATIIVDLIAEEIEETGNRTNALASLDRLIANSADKPGRVLHLAVLQRARNEIAAEIGERT